MNLLYILLPLYIMSKLEDGIKGKTRLQKLLFLIQIELSKKGINLGLDFEPAPYGPYSVSLGETIDMMSQKGLIKEELVGTSKVLHIFTINDAGNKLLEESQSLISNDVKKVVEEVVDRYGDTQLNELLDFVHKEHPDFVKKHSLIL